MRRYLAIVGPDHTWRDRRSLALASAMNTEAGDPPLPDKGPCVGHMFMVSTTLHLPGWPKAIRCFGLVRRSVGGESGTLPAWDSLCSHFERREKRQNRLLSMPDMGVRSTR